MHAYWPSTFDSQFKSIDLGLGPKPTNLWDQSSGDWLPSFPIHWQMLPHHVQYNELRDVYKKQEKQHIATHCVMSQPYCSIVMFLPISIGHQHLPWCPLVLPSCSGSPPPSDAHPGLWCPHLHLRAGAARRIGPAWRLVGSRLSFGAESCKRTMCVYSTCIVVYSSFSLQQDPISQLVFANQLCITEMCQPVTQTQWSALWAMRWCQAVIGFVLSRLTSHPKPRELYKKLQAAFLLYLTETWMRFV